MKKHILSKYSSSDSTACEKSMGVTTYETSTIEVSDPDEFLLDPTNFTKSIEDSDSDEFVLGPTLQTEIDGEVSDPDEFALLGPTKGTFTSEDTDPDEFIVGDILCKIHEGDFDELLLL